MKHAIEAPVLASCLLLAACTGGPAPTATQRATTGSSASPVPSTADASPPVAASATPAASRRDFVVGGDRPVTVHVPASYDPAVAAPLLIRLHGYADGGYQSEAYLQLGSAAAAHGMLYAYPDGTTDGRGYRFWNATDACCDFGSSGVDDSAYLADVIADIQAQANVDPKRIYVFGHSNGGFMSYRMACDHADAIAAIVSLAAATYGTAADCGPMEPVAVLEIHGTADDIVRFEGGNLASFITGTTVADYPGARRTVEMWASYDGCAPSLDAGLEPIDLDAGLAGPAGPRETVVEAYASGCRPGGHVELWTIAGGTHVPDPATGFADAVVEFMLAHPKP